MPGSAHKGGILASQIRCAEPTLVAFAASRAFPPPYRRAQRFSSHAGAAGSAAPGDAVGRSEGPGKPRPGLGLPCWEQRWQEGPGPCHGALQSCEGGQASGCFQAVG